MSEALASAPRRRALQLWIHLVGLAMSSLLAACGGGSSGGPPAAALEAIKIAPQSSATPALLISGIGQLRQLSLTGTYSDGTTADVTNQATWTSGTPAVATIGGAPGLVTGVGLGSTNITATIGSLTDTVSFSVVTAIWTPTATMQIPRNAGHTATLLADGNFLIVGGTSTTSGSALAEAEIYHPLTDTWTLTTNPPLTLEYHTATLLNDGTVLVTGDGGPQNKVEIYDPVANAWTQVPPMQYTREYHTATLLASGRVLVAGGYTDGGPTNSAELYDPVTKSWSTAAPMPEPRVLHTATQLPDGDVLVTDGFTQAPSQSASFCATAAFVYNPTSDQWTPTGNMLTPRCGSTTTLLANGQILMAGGNDDNDTPLSSTEIYDPKGSTWSPGPSLLLARIGASAARLPDGKVLIAGGQAPCQVGLVPFCTPPPPGQVSTAPTASSELFDPGTNAFSAAASLNVARVDQTATPAPNGVVLVVGGAYTQAAMPEPASELYW